MRRRKGDVAWLWAPWRTPYVSKAKRGRYPCIFCLAKQSRNDRQALVIYRDHRSFALLNRYPYIAGHLLVSIYRHVPNLSDLTAQEASELLRVTTYMVELLTKILRPHGFNIGLNLGSAAGAGIPGHLHLHVVPRWVGDVNFMPIIGNTKIISASLEVLHRRLRHLARAGK